MTSSGNRSCIPADNLTGFRASSHERSLSRRVGKPQYLVDPEYKDINESLPIGSACARRRMESLDDQIQAFWPGSNSVSGDRNACTGGG
jgi:hypothetical protein